MSRPHKPILLTVPPHGINGINVRSVLDLAAQILAADSAIHAVEIESNWDLADRRHPTGARSSAVYHRAPTVAAPLGFASCIATQELADSPALIPLFRLQRTICSAGWLHEMLPGFQILTLVVDRQGAALRASIPGIAYFVVAGLADPARRRTAPLKARFPNPDEGRVI